MDHSEAPAALPAVPGRREERALSIVRVGAIGVILLAVTFQEFELDRFFVPKELLLHAAAFLSLLFLLPSRARARPPRVDTLLIAFLVVSVVSAALATNIWTAWRAVTLTGSSIAIYWVGREMRSAGLGRPVLVALGVAVVTGCVTSLLQAYGVETDLFSVNRSPGGTLGNRNFVAHLAAFGFPIVLLCSLRAWRGAGYAMGAVGVMLVAGTLVMTRSRAGWLAFGGALVVFVAAMVISRALRGDRRSWLRFIGIVPFVAAGAIGAVFIPNSLEWRSENPYLESVQGLANYQEGSGRGRLVQYGQSLRMALDHPILGVGPGNWPVRYPEYAVRQDPSLDASAPGTTSNPWPSSDWIAFIAERGAPAAILLLLALGGLALAAFRRVIDARDPDEGLQSAALLSTIVAAGVAGAFDAVLLLALPAFIVWLGIGALSPPGHVESRGMSPTAARLAAIFLLVVSASGMIRSGSHLFSMAVYTKSEDTDLMRAAAAVDPGNYRLQLKLARPGGGRDREIRCRHALAAEALFPNARAARNLADGC